MIIVTNCSAILQSHSRTHFFFSSSSIVSSSPSFHSCPNNLPPTVFIFLPIYSLTLTFFRLIISWLFVNIKTECNRTFNSLNTSESSVTQHHYHFFIRFLFFAHTHIHTRPNSSHTRTHTDSSLQQRQSWTHRTYLRPFCLHTTSQTCVSCSSLLCFWSQSPWLTAQWTKNGNHSR